MSIRAMRVARTLAACALLLPACPRVSRAASAPPPAARDTAVPGVTRPATAPADSTPAESPPGPLLIPGRPSPADNARPSAAQRAREAYALGRSLEASGRYGPAIVSYRNALRIDPELPDVSHRMAMLYLSRDRVDEAVKCLLIELQHHPDNLDASRELGLCFARFGDYPRAIGHLEGLAREHPKDGLVWHALGSVYLAAARPRDAQTALERALRLGPTTAELLRDMGATLSSMGHNADARLYYRRAVSLDPDDAASWLNLGNLERRAGRPDSALVLYQRAEAADSGFAPALDAQVQLLSAAKRDAEVLDVYRRRLAQHPDHFGARLEAIRLLEAQNREAEALALARDGVVRVPTDGQSYLILGLVLRGHGDTHGAMTALYKAQRLFLANPIERERVTKTIASIRASAPDSLRSSFAADSIASFPHPRRAPGHIARPDSIR